MANHRYFEAIKRLLNAETYFRAREEVQAREPKSRPEENQRDSEVNRV